MLCKKSSIVAPSLDSAYSATDFKKSSIFKHLFSVRSKHSSVHGEEGQQEEKDSDEDLGLVLMMYMSGPTS